MRSSPFFSFERGKNWLEAVCTKRSGSGLLGGTRAVEVRCSALTERPGHLRAAVARVLGQVGKVRAIEPLPTVLPEKRMSARRATLWMLCRVRDSRAVEPLLAPLQQRSGQQHRAVVEALSRPGDARTGEPLAFTTIRTAQSKTAIWKALDRLKHLNMKDALSL
jgi:hypothetical protein